MPNSHPFKLSKRLLEQLQDKHWIKRELNKGKTVQEILAFSESNMEKFYKAAFALYEQKDYEKSANAFLFLVTLNPKRPEYWLGLGMSLQLFHRYEEAIDAYEMAAICDIHSPVPYFYLAKCLFAIHDRKNALEALELAIEYADESADYQELKSQAKAAKALLLKE